MRSANRYPGAGPNRHCLPQAAWPRRLRRSVICTGTFVTAITPQSNSWGRCSARQSCGHHPGKFYFDEEQSASSHEESLDCFVARAPRNDGEGFALSSPRHCERSEAIQEATKQDWIASSQELLAMTGQGFSTSLSPSLRAKQSRRPRSKDWIA